MADDPGSLVPITVLTGFLGAGKTTLLRALLRRPALARTAVVVNELGEIGLDHELVERAEESVLLLEGGCLCCTVRGDLVRALDRLWRARARGRAEFERVVIETTGLADPLPILQTLIADPVTAARYRLDGVVTLVDAVNGAATLETSPEAVRQVAVADRLVVSKADLAEPAALARLEGRLRTLNPAAPVLRAVNGELDPLTVLDCGPWSSAGRRPEVERWLGALATEPAAGGTDGHAHRHGQGEEPACHGHRHDHRHEAASAEPDVAHDGPRGRPDAGGTAPVLVGGAPAGGAAGRAGGEVAQHRHRGGGGTRGHGIRTFCVRRAEPISAAAASLLLTLLAAQRGPDLLRVKGVLAIREDPDRPLVIHAVQHIVHEPVVLDRWPSADRSSRLVMITRELAPEQVEGLWDAVLAFEREQAGAAASLEA